MRTLVDIPDHQIDNLNILCKEEDVSRAEIIRRAINEYISKKSLSDQDAFGLWKVTEEVEDGMQYQEGIRSEW